ncbi:hypothetical protein QP698_13125 [Enterococcus faecalis]|nr:hypothetical protein [Enterococcus faecalis]MDK6555785.1 hypothetical protein [Enterococcus faecalis]MDK8072591.1 hypothetical protein [Enterococcus faecalis]
MSEKIRTACNNIYGFRVVEEEEINKVSTPRMNLPNEEWFAEFRHFFYDYETLEEIAEYITFNVVHNNETFIDGIGIPLRNGKRPYWLKKDEEVNEHVNVIYNSYDTEIEYD